MYCLSKICCLCLQSKKQLILLNKTRFSTSQIDMIKILIGESLFSELGHVLSICNDCTRRVEEMHSFWQISVENNKILMKYLRQLRILSNDFGHVRIQIDDVMYSTDPEILIYKDKFCTNKNIYTDKNDTDGGLKIKEEDDQELSSLSGNEGDATTYKTLVEENCQYAIRTNIENEIKTKVHEKIYEVYVGSKCQSNEMQVEYSEKSIGENGAATLIKEEPVEEVSEAQECEIKEEFADEQKRITTMQTGEKSHKCEICGESFTCNSNLTSHMLVHTGEEPRKCETCGKSFVSKRDLTKHMLLHVGEKPHKRETCGQSSTTHILSRTGEKPHKCGACGKSYTLECNLNRHMLIHTKKSYDCETCGKRFILHSALSKHILTHTGELFMETPSEKLHICETCGKSSASKKYFNKHMTLHVCERPHKCGACGRSFAYEHILTAHMATHADDRPYRCRICAKCYNTKDGMKSHYLLHTNNKIHKCESCRVYFKCNQTVHTDENHYKCKNCNVICRVLDFGKK